MRSEKEIMDLILDTAKNDERVRAVIMNGSRVNPNAKKDFFQDYDVVYIVRDIDSFTCDHSWIDRFGELMILQMPEAMGLIPPVDDGHFVYLMQFKDGNRIDLALIPIEKADQLIERDSLSVLLLNKDGIVEPFPPSSDKDYYAKKPTKKEFEDCCNEFWWVSPYVAKGLWREEILYAKVTLEKYIRNMLNKMVEWYVGVNTNYSVSIGKAGKYLNKYLEPEIWEELLQTYPNAEYESIWQAHFKMCDLFRKLATRVAEKLDFEYNYQDDKNVMAHLKHVKNLPKDAKEMY